MVYNLPFLAFGLFLLWCPRQWLRRGAVFRRSSTRRARWKDEPWNKTEPGDPRLTMRAEFSKVRNYVDLLRAAAGSLAIVGGAGIDAAVSVGSVDRAANWQVLGLKAGILLVGVVIQTIRFEGGRLSFFAPIFYLAGLSVSVCGHWAALFAFVLIWSLNTMFAGAHAFLTVYAVLLGVFGVLFRGMGSRLPLIAVALCLFPVVLSLLTRRRLGTFARRGAHSQEA